MDKKKCCQKKLTRIAWFNRDNNEYNYGAWHKLDTKTPADYIELNEWVTEQNKKYPRTKYWIDIKDSEDALPKNSESYDLMPIIKSTHTEWLAL